MASAPDIQYGSDVITTLDVEISSRILIELKVSKTKSGRGWSLGINVSRKLDFNISCIEVTGVGGSCNEN